MELIKRNVEKLLALFCLTLVMLWLFMTYSKQDRQMEAERAQLELSNLTNVLSLHMDREIGFLELTAEKLNRQLMNKSSENDLRAQLKYVINRQAYQYGVFISPDRVINGTELISPSMLMDSGKKRYGDRVFWSTPIVNYEKMSAMIPIYQPLSEPRLGVSGVLFREVSVDYLVEKAYKLSAERKGIVFLISDEKQVIQLLPPDSDSSKLVASSLESYLTSILNQSFRMEDDKKFIFSERIGSSHWNLVYIEPYRASIQMIYLLAGILIIPIILMLVVIITADKKYKVLNLELKNLRLNEEMQKAKSEDLILDTIKAEAYQIDWLRSQDRQYSHNIMVYKLEVLLAKLLEKNDYSRTLSLKELVQWVSGINETVGIIRIECGAGSERLHLNSAMVFEFVFLFEILLSCEGLRQIEISPDVMNQLLVISLYGDQIFNTSSLENLLNEKTLDTYKRKVQRSFIGNRIVYKLETHKPVVEKPSVKSTVDQVLPSSVAIYSPDYEGHAIIKFYLDYMGLKYSTINDLKSLADVDVVLASSRAMKQIVEAKSLGMPILSRLVLCKDDSEDDIMLEASCDWIIHRPYSLDKIQQILYSVQRKKNSG